MKNKNEITNKEVFRNARVKVFGIKKRCRKPSSETFETKAKTDKEAIELLKIKVKSNLDSYRVVDGFSNARCQDIIYEDFGDYKIKKFNIFCDSEAVYEFSV